MNTPKLFLRCHRPVAQRLLAGVASVAPAIAQTAAAAPNEYRLGPGDVVRITVYQNPDLTLETRIGEAGVVSYPLLGSVRLGGTTVTQAEKLIADGLRSGNFVKQPQVSILVVQVRGNQASVLGQVNRPGPLPDRSGGHAAVGHPGRGRRHQRQRRRHLDAGGHARRQADAQGDRPARASSAATAARTT